MLKFLAIISVTVSVVTAQELSPSELLDRVRSTYASMNDASALFTQSVSMRYKKTVHYTTGSVKIKKGNKYRLETEKQSIVTDGISVWMYSPETKQVLKDKFKNNNKLFSPDAFLAGIPKEYSVTTVVKDSQYFILSLVPAKSGESSTLIAGLKIWVHPESWFFDKIEIINTNNTTTTITLSNILFNKGIPDKEFHFEILGDMKVVDLTAMQ